MGGCHGIQGYGNRKNDEKYKKMGYPMLIRMSIEGHIAKVEQLINDGTDLCVTDDHGNNALHWSASRGFSSIISTILAVSSDKRPDINSINNFGMTPLHEACRSEHEITVGLLYSEGASMDIIDEYGNLPMDYISEKNKQQFLQTMESFLHRKKVFAQSGIYDDNDEECISTCC